jgi:hypothetical protein
MGSKSSGSASGSTSSIRTKIPTINLQATAADADVTLIFRSSLLPLIRPLKIKREESNKIIKGIKDPKQVGFAIRGFLSVIINVSSIIFSVFT